MYFIDVFFRSVIEAATLSFARKCPASARFLRSGLFPSCLYSAANRVRILRVSTRIVVQLHGYYLLKQDTTRYMSLVHQDARCAHREATTGRSSSWSTLASVCVTCARRSVLYPSASPCIIRPISRNFWVLCFHSFVRCGFPFPLSGAPAPHTSVCASP